MCEVGLTRKEFSEITLGEYFEREYHFEYKNQMYLHGVRMNMQVLISINSEKGKSPTLKELYHLPLIDKEPLKEKSTPLPPLLQRETAEESVRKFNY